MNPQAFMRELEPLTHHERVQRMVALGREPAANRDPLLDELSRGSVYERRLVAFSCFGSGDAERAYTLALDPSGFVYGLANRLVAKFCTDEQLLTLLQTLPAARHHKLLVQWSKARRSTASIDTWAKQLLAEGQDQQAHEVLPFTSPGLVERELNRVLDSWDVATWGRLARRHSRLVAGELLHRAQESREQNNALTYQVDSVLAYLAERLPDEALRLVTELERTTPLSSITLNHLVNPRPQGVAELVLSSTDDPPYLNLTPKMRLLSGHTIKLLLQNRGSVLPYWEDTFGKLPAKLRAELAATALQKSQRDDGVVPPVIVAALPSDLRISEARRHLALPSLQARLSEKLTYARFLPWDEAKSVLSDYFRHPDPLLRAEAISHLIFALRYDRARQDELLPLLTARKNEQDPVRLAMLSGLADLPPGLWRESSLPALTQVLQDALNAADLSTATVAQAQLLVIKLLPFWPQWAADWLSRIVQARGQVNFGYLEGRLTKQEAGRVIAALTPVLKSWEVREREQHLLGALTLLGKFVQDHPVLLEMLEDRVWHSKNEWLSVRALGILKEHQPDRFQELVPRLLAKDPSWGTQPVVYEYLHRSRQDLLTPYLGRTAFKGRFSTGRTRFVLPFDTGFVRWTLSQQRTFTQTLVELTKDTERDFPAVWRAIHVLSVMPAQVPLQLSGAPDITAPEDTPLHRLEQLAAVQNTNLAIRDRAIRGLAHLDAGRGVPALLACLEDDRARLAIYALRRPFLDLRPADALRLLLQVPREKVTVAKEVVRLIGELPTEAAFQTLVQLSGENLHRDVRVALLRGLWNHLHRPESWPILLAAARSGDAALSDGLVRLPARSLTGEAHEQYLNLLKALLTHTDVKVRIDTLTNQTAVTDPERKLLPTVLGLLNSPDTQENTLAAQMLFRSYAENDAAIIGQTFAELLPQRRALRSALNALLQAAGTSRRKAEPIVKAVLDALAVDPLTMPLQVELAVKTLAWPELAQQFQAWARGGLLYAEPLMLAVRAIENAGDRTDGADIEQLETGLMGQSEQTRRLALAALTAAAQSHGGWTPERLTRLWALREDPSRLVASAAQFTLPGIE